MNARCNLLSLSSHVPSQVLTNDDLAKMVDTSDEWITTRTGIKERRRLAATENASDLGYKAALKALDEAGMKAGELTHVIAATCTPDSLCPSVACIISGKLGAGAVMAFDVSAACSGFLYGLSLCRSILAQDPAARILFVCAEALTRRSDWTDRSTCVLFGDGAGACILTADDRPPLATLEDAICKSDGSLNQLITVGSGTASQHKQGDPVGSDFFIHMQGREVYRHAVRQMSSICEEILERNGLSIRDVDLFVPHQANLRIIEAVGSRLEIDADKVFTNVEHYGNTSSASVPLALVEARAQGRLEPGMRVLMTAFGGGLTFGATLLRF